VSTRSLLPSILCLVLAACAIATPSSPSAIPTQVPTSAPTPVAVEEPTPIPTPSPVEDVTNPPQPTSPPAATSSTLVLRQAPGNFGCDAIGVEYRSVTFRINRESEEQVVAVTDGGKNLRTSWSPSFYGTGTADPVIRDAAADIVVRDGDILPMPDGTWPRLHGYFVCAGTDTLAVLDRDPE